MQNVSDLNTNISHENITAPADGLAPWGAGASAGTMMSSGFCCALFCSSYISQFMVDSCDSFTHILQGCFTDTGVLYDCPQCQWSNLWRCGCIQSVPKQPPHKQQQNTNNLYTVWIVFMCKKYQSNSSIDFFPHKWNSFFVARTLCYQSHIL